MSRKLTRTVHDTRTVPYSAWGRKARSECPAKCPQFAYASLRYFAGDPDGKEGDCITTLGAVCLVESVWVRTKIIRSVPIPALNFFEDGTTRLSLHSVYSKLSYIPTERLLERSYTLTKLLQRRNYAPAL